jgi:hypothetical protein
MKIHDRNKKIFRKNYNVCRGKFDLKYANTCLEKKIGIYNDDRR